tara:strand:- start:258 stop:494 length:237 start_codon:yes stop_codon:yes gene_type:complete
MTEFSEAVEKQIELLKAEEWGKQVKMVIGEGGYVTYYFNNGDKQIINSTTHETTWEYADEKKKSSLVEKFNRWLADQR